MSEIQIVDKEQIVSGGNCLVKLPQGHQYDFASVRVDHIFHVLFIGWSIGNERLAGELINLREYPELANIYTSENGFNVQELEALLAGSFSEVEHEYSV
mgnify:CR=1 FL=1